MARKSITVALAGNPNSGKSTIFNNLTGARQKIGNWPGVTVEKKEGHLASKGYHLTIVDLPGTYSLTAYSIEEIVARNFILDEKPDVVVAIIDASNLERNLYLATQLRELDTKVIFVLNMADVANGRGDKIDGNKLSELLDVPVVFTVGNKNEGTQGLIKSIISVVESDIELPRTRRVKYGKDIERAIGEFSEFIRDRTDEKLPYNIRWIAIKLLENDKIVKKRILEIDSQNGEAILREAEQKRGKLRQFFDDEPEIVMTDHRYGFIAGIIKEVLKSVSKSRVDVSRQIDQVLTNRLLGIPMLMGFGCNVPAIMATRTLESEKDRVLTILINPLMSCSARLPVYILLAGTFFGAKAGNAIFSIYALGIVLAIVIGRLFRSTLLRGKIAPFVMELPPYRAPMLRSLLIHMWDRSKIFLRKMGGVILIGSVVVWFLSAFPQEVQFSRDYETEIARGTAQYEISIAEAEGGLREELVRKRDKAVSAIEAEMAKEKVERSYMGRLGKMFAPVFAPIGMDWRGSVAVLTGFVAKEIVVSTMGVLYAVGSEEDERSEALKLALKRSGMTPLSAYAMMAFVLIYVPCLATVAVIRRETNSWKWTFFSIFYSTGLAWFVAFIIYQGGSVIGLG